MSEPTVPDPTTEFKLGREQGRNEVREDLTGIIDDLSQRLADTEEAVRKRNRKIRRLRTALQEAQVDIDGDNTSRASQRITRALEEEPEDEE